MDAEKPPTAVVDVDELFADFEEAPEEIAAPASNGAPPPKPVERVYRKDKMLALKAENRRLREEVQLLKRIGSSASEVSRSIGPAAHLCFFNRKLSVESRRKIEDFALELARSSQELSDRETNATQCNAPTHWSTKSQQSAISLTSETVQFLDDDDEDGDSAMDASTAASSTAGLAITGSVQVHGGFLIDTLGAPVVSDVNGTLSSYEAPVYRRSCHHILPCSQEEVTAKLSKGGMCFNCGQQGHNMSDCKEPRDEGSIQRNRQQFQSTRTPQRTPQTSRYHLDPSNMLDGHHSKFRPGEISAELRQALGLSVTDVPLHIYRMRMHGYPPAYRVMDDHSKYSQNKVKCALSLYSGEDDVAEDVMEVDQPDNAPPSKIEYTPTSKETIRYPGFNCPLPANAIDQCHRLGYPPYAPGSVVCDGKSPASAITIASPVRGRTEQSGGTSAATAANAAASPIPISVTISETMHVDSPPEDKRRSAKFERGDGDGDDSAEDAEEGEVASSTASPTAIMPSMPSENVMEATEMPAESADTTTTTTTTTTTAAAAAVPQANECEEILLVDLGVGDQMLEEESAVKTDAPTAAAAQLRRQWSTDFPPDMAPSEGELKHTWLSLRKIVDERRSQDSAV